MTPATENGGSIQLGGRFGSVHWSHIVEGNSGSVEADIAVRLGAKV